jgi:glycosyltransferase involved in cell wall biosynthesis
MPRNTQISVLIGVPSFRRPDALRKLLESLAEQTGVENFRIEVFVADNDAKRRESVDVCREMARSFRWPLGTDVVEQRGISAARNAILMRTKQTGADFVAMIDDDEVATPRWLSELLRIQGEFDADVVGGPVYQQFDESAPAKFRNCGLFVTPKHSEGIILAIRGAGNILLSCARLRDVGWPKFDLAYGLSGGEDREFFTRLAQLRFRFAWAPGACATESVPASRTRERWVLRRAFNDGNVDMRIWRQHGRGLQPMIALGKSIILLLSAPLGAFLLLVPTRRLWMLAKWSRSLGKVAALLGYYSNEYSSRRPEGAST